MHNIAFLDDVILHFEAQTPRFFRTLLAVAANVIVVGNHFRTDEAAFEVRVNFCCGFRRRRANTSRPGPDLLRPRCEIGLEPK